MKTMRLAILCFVLVVANAVVSAQTSKATGAAVKTNPAPQSSTKTAKSEADELREQQLRVFREHILARTFDSVKKMDEPGLRLSARNQILMYLSSDKAPSDEKETLATQMALDALADFRDHGHELLPFMAGYLANDLGSWILKNRPNLTEAFEKSVKADPKTSAPYSVHSLLELENGDVLAARRIRQLVEEQSPLDGLFFWLDELSKRQSKEFEPLALEIVVRARQGQMSFENLFWISDIYLRPQTSATLRNRFLAAVVSRTQPVNFVVEPPTQTARDLLTKLLPFIQQSSPELYEQAINQNFAMRAALNERQAASEARAKRLKESQNPIEDLLSEAKTTKSDSERNELLLQAAQLALTKSRFDVCLDILTQVDVSVATGDPNSWQRSIDQILKNFVKAVVTAKHPELAEKAAGRIAATLAHVEALGLIMRYWSKANDKPAAQRLLLEASKVAGSGSTDTEKAKAFFLLSIICDQADESKKAELLLSGIKALNNLAKPDTNSRDQSTAYQNYVRDLDNSGYELTKGFKSLTKQDQNGALALVERLQKPDLRPFALLGILLGLDGLITQPAG